MPNRYPKRLIEVDLPIKRISAHARREKNLRHGHISSLHIWWARRPLAACRAVLCASLWPDPADELCPQSFRDEAARHMKQFAETVLADKKLAENCDPGNREKWLMVANPEFAYDTANPEHLNMLRFHLLDFIADFANWDNSAVKEYLETSRALTQAAHEGLGGMPGTRPLVVDPFAGGGSIPLEALRVGADAFASDLNPVATLLNKVILEYIPIHGQQLADEVRNWGEWIKEEAEKELAEFYPKDPDGAMPIAYLWARTVQCEGPGCGAEVPLIRSLWLAKKDKRSVALRMIPNPAEKHVDFDIIENAVARDVREGTAKRGAATCPCCGYTTRVESVRRQLKERRGGATDARMFAVATTRPGEQGRFYRLPAERDLDAARKAAGELERRKLAHSGSLTLVPDEEIPVTEIRRISIPLYGISTWGDMFSPRQALAISTLSALIQRLQPGKSHDVSYAAMVCLALAVDKLADRCSTMCTWIPQSENMGHTFGRQAIGMVWDYVEVPWVSPGIGWDGLVANICSTIEASGQLDHCGTATQASATHHPLPDDSADIYFTDPPYYDAVPYAHLSDFFYVWLKRSLQGSGTESFQSAAVAKQDEIVVDRPHRLSDSTKDIRFYESHLQMAFADGRRVLGPRGLGSIVFASKTTASWEAILQAVVNAGWIITGSWPIDTEREARLAALEQARLASSVHLICRPRENADGSLMSGTIGDWRDVLHELPVRIHEWMPRLAREGVVGADAIFACLGPALEVFSRYSQVEKASGEQVSLKEYLEEVWAVVAREALTLIFDDADTSDFEEDARLTSIWFWVLKEAANGNGHSAQDSGETEDNTDSSEGDEERPTGRKPLGFSMEYDAARKLAQGLGADLQKLSRQGGIVTISGNVARLNTVGEREQSLVGMQMSLFGDAAPCRQAREGRTESGSKAMLRHVHDRQGKLFDETDGSARGRDEPTLPLIGLQVEPLPLIDRLVDSGATVLDRLHQAMLLFSRSQTSLIGPLLAETRMGNDQRFWRLAQALSALYPKDSDEKRWVDGVLARKKGLGF